MIFCLISDNPNELQTCDGILRFQFLFQIVGFLFKDAFSSNSAIIATPLPSGDWLKNLYYTIFVAFISHHK